LKRCLRIRAFAKINLGLRILRRRRDGYHEIRTIYQTVGLHDRLEISLSDSGRGLKVECDDATIPEGPGNLVHRACNLWRRARRYRGGIWVRLEKSIPSGSGLGGASSDAAATLLNLERLTGDRLRQAVRFKLARMLGSDVPLFLWGGRVLGCGRGEEVYPLADLPDRRCLIVFPGFSLSTSQAYREASLRLTKCAGPARMKILGEWPPFPLDRWGPAENDFEMVVFARWPKLARLKAQLIRAGAEVASLTGSGSAVFALFDSARKLHQATNLVPQGWQIFQTRTQTRDEYLRAVTSEE